MDFISKEVRSSAQRSIATLPVGLKLRTLVQNLLWGIEKSETERDRIEKLCRSAIVNRWITPKLIQEITGDLSTTAELGEKYDQVFIDTFVTKNLYRSGMDDLDKKAFAAGAAAMYVELHKEA